MKLRIVEESDKTCCFELFNKTERIECGKKVVAKDGEHRHICREHTGYAVQFAEAFEDAKGKDILKKQFIKLLGETNGNRS